MSDDRVVSLRELEKQRELELERLWEESLGSGPSRPLMQKAAYPPRISLNGLLIGLFLTMGLAFSGFVPLEVPSPLSLHSETTTEWMGYSLQLPLALFIGAFLGPYMGTLAILTYLGVGLFALPVFANGGGMEYLTQPGFGYLLGMLAAAFLAGRTFHKVFQKQDGISRSVKICLTVLGLVCVVHAVGLIYLTGLSLLGMVSWYAWPGWALRLTVEPVLYDIGATAVLFCMVRQLRLFLWLVLY